MPNPETLSICRHDEVQLWPGASSSTNLSASLQTANDNLWLRPTGKTAVNIAMNVNDKTIKVSDIDGKSKPLSSSRMVDGI